MSETTGKADWLMDTFVSADTFTEAIDKYIELLHEALRRNGGVDLQCRCDHQINELGMDPSECQCD